MAVDPNRIQIEQMKRVLLAQEIVVEQEELGPPSLRLLARIPRSSQAGQRYAVSPQSLEQMLFGFGWRVTQVTALPEAFAVVLEKPRLTPT